MKNWKHSMSAFMAVVMVGSLATVQLKDMSAVSASKENEEEIVLDILEGDGNGETIDFDKIDAMEVKNTVEETINSFNKVEITKPYEPKAGYVIATSGVLNVRAEKDINSEIIGRLNPGMELWLEGEYEDWYLISFTSEGVEKKGYVSKEFVTTSYDEAKDILLQEVMYEKVTISAGAEMKSAPDINASPIELFQNDEAVIIISKVDDNWSQIYTTDDYTSGYVLNSALSADGEMVLKEDVVKDRAESIKAIGTQGVVYSAVGSVNVRTMPGEDKDIKITLPSGTSCLLVKTIGDWVKISYGDGYIAGYVKSEYTMTKNAYDAMKAEEARKLEEAKKKKEEQNKKQQTASSSSKAAKNTSSASSAVSSSAVSSSSSKGQQIVNIASKYLGVRYVYGGTSPSGFDCSGLVQYVCRQAGISVNRTSRDQYNNGVAVAKSNLQPGDLVFFAKGSSISHVGIYAGNGQVIHSPRPGKSVCYVSFASMCSYSNYVGARRVY